MTCAILNASPGGAPTMRRISPSTGSHFSKCWPLGSRKPYAAEFSAHRNTPKSGAAPATTSADCLRRAGMASAAQIPLAARGDGHKSGKAISVAASRAGGSRDDRRRFTTQRRPHRRRRDRRMAVTQKRGAPGGLGVFGRRARAEHVGGGTIRASNRARRWAYVVGRAWGISRVTGKGERRAWLQDT
jgi:hypothetical protein